MAKKALKEKPAFWPVFTFGKYLEKVFGISLVSALGFWSLRNHYGWRMRILKFPGIETNFKWFNFAEFHEISIWSNITIYARTLTTSPPKPEVGVGLLTVIDIIKMVKFLNNHEYIHTRFFCVYFLEWPLLTIAKNSRKGNLSLFGSLWNLVLESHCKISEKR